MKTIVDRLDLRHNFLLHFALLFGTVVAFHAKKPPFENEFIYLLRLVTPYDSNFLLNDMSFAVPGSEHWLFNHLFGLLTFVFSIEFISWSGRIFCWTALLLAIMRLAKHWEIPLWMVTVSIFLWLARGQSIIAGEWIIGSFEAKCIAYICLLFALDGFARDKAAYPAILLGLTFSFHPAVGMWGILAAGIAMLICRWEWRRLRNIAVLVVVFALPGLIPLVSEVAKTASVEDWKFVELSRFPHLMDPFSWSKSSIVLVFLQLTFCLLFFYSGKAENRRKFLPAFLTALGSFFTIGLILRGFEQYELLRFMPMRLFPVFVPLFFFFSFGEAYRRKLFPPPLKAIAVVGFVCLLFWQSPFSSAANLLTETYRSWTVELDDTARSFVWLRENTPNGTTVIAPPWRQDFWYLSNRAQFASAGFPTYIDLREWRERVEMASGESLSNKTNVEDDNRPAFYHALTTDQITEMARRCNATYLVSESDYPYPVVFSSGRSKVFYLGLR